MEDVQPGRSLHSVSQSSFLFSTNEREETRSIFGICTYLLLEHSVHHFKPIYIGDVLRFHFLFLIASSVSRKEENLRPFVTQEQQISLSLSLRMNSSVTLYCPRMSPRILHVAPADKHALPLEKQNKETFKAFATDLSCHSGFSFQRKTKFSFRLH